MMVYVAGRLGDVSPREMRRLYEGAVCPRWHVLGIYQDLGAASARCREEYDFVMPIELDADQPEEITPTDCTWPHAKANP